MRARTRARARNAAYLTGLTIGHVYTSWLAGRLNAYAGMRTGNLQHVVSAALRRLSFGGKLARLAS